MKKHLLYLKYVLLHKWYVFVECCRLGIPFRGLIHDWSKFLPSEWRMYAQYFYGDWSENKETMNAFSDFGVAEAAPMGYFTKDRFNVSWNYHQKRNKHHWQYWVCLMDDGGETYLPMPDKYRREMLADWRGAGRAIHGRDETKSWYLKNYDHMKIERQTQIWIEERLGIAESEKLEQFVLRHPEAVLTTTH